ncbi:hypothetical protein HZ326_29436 [Fusarium oxysporum f. sp. albedinis]|nr:hypothetical protein HZ326_29436 [Fusarium oxysporum f. sp. albedinis]
MSYEGYTVKIHCSGARLVGIRLWAGLKSTTLHDTFMDMAWIGSLRTHSLTDRGKTSFLRSNTPIGIAFCLIQLSTYFIKLKHCIPELDYNSWYFSRDSNLLPPTVMRTPSPVWHCPGLEAAFLPFKNIVRQLPCIVRQFTRTCEVDPMPLNNMFVRLDMKRGPYFWGRVSGFSVSYSTGCIKDSNSHDISLNSYA